MTISHIHVRTLAAATLVLAAATAHATMAVTYPVRLSARDKAAIVDMACPRTNPRAAERLNAYRYFERQGEPVTVDLVCVPHRKTAVGIVRARAVCDNSSGEWRCREEGDFLEVKVGSRSVHVPASAAEADIAVGIARYLLSIDSYDGQALASLIEGSTCTLSPDPPDVWDVNCGALGIEVARDCDHAPCRYRAFGPLRVAVP